MLELRGRKYSIANLVDKVILPTVVAIAFVLSIANSIWKFLDSAWQITLVLIVLFVLLRWTGDIRERTAALDAGVYVENFRNSAQFYEELSYAVRNAKHTVRASYQRLQPPSLRIEEERAYFEHVVAWAQEKPPGQRSLQRLIRVPEGNEAMQRWAAEQLERAVEVGENLSIRIIPTGSNQPEGVSFTIIDDEVVFLGFGLDSDVSGYRIDSRDVAESYRYHFLAVWTSELARARLHW